MTWNKIFQIAWNTALQFGLTYLVAYGSGANNKVALGTAAASVLSGQVALNQTAPRDKLK